MRGPHFLKSWSSTQRTVALSLGESELHACNRVGRVALGMVHIAKDFGENLGVKNKIDAKVTMVTLHQQGSGTLEQVDTSAL